MTEKWTTERLSFCKLHILMCSLKLLLPCYFSAWKQWVRRWHYIFNHHKQCVLHSETVICTDHKANVQLYIMYLYSSYIPRSLQLYTKLFLWTICFFKVFCLSLSVWIVAILFTVSESAQNYAILMAQNVKQFGFYFCNFAMNISTYFA